MTGHIRHHELDDYDYELVTIVREPTERLISHYYHYKGVSRKYEKNVEWWNKDTTIIEMAEAIPNLQANYIGSLSKFSFVGLKEEFEETLKRFGVWGNIKIPTTYKNYNPTRKKQVSDKDRKIIREFNKEDYKIYREVCKTWHHQ